MVRLKIAYWEFDFEAVCPTLDHDLLSQAHIYICCFFLCILFCPTSALWRLTVWVWHFESLLGYFGNSIIHQTLFSNMDYISTWSFMCILLHIWYNLFAYTWEAGDGGGGGAWFIPQNNSLIWRMFGRVGTEFDSGEISGMGTKPSTLWPPIHLVAKLVVTWLCLIWLSQVSRHYHQWHSYIIII